jgi:hypothetical protein
LSEIKEEEEVIKQVNIGSKNAGLIAGDKLDIDADFVSFP